MRLIDGDKLYAVLDNIANHLLEMKSEPQSTMGQTIQYVMGIVMDQPDIIPSPNDLLTLEELREMDGEPVWCVDGRGNQCWCLVNCDDGLPCCYDNETGLWEDCFYGMTGDGRFGLHQSGWLAYRSKPEEGTNAVT